MGLFYISTTWDCSTSETAWEFSTLETALDCSTTETTWDCSFSVTKWCGETQTKMAPIWLPCRLSLALNKPYLYLLIGSGVPPPGVTYLGMPGGMS